MSIRSVMAGFGRASHAPSQFRTLSGPTPAAPAPAADPCSLGEFLGETPVDTTTGAPKTLSNGMMAGLELAGLLTLGAVAGAFVSQENRGRNVAIGGGLGAVVGAGIAFYQFGNWKDEGGTRHKPGACAGGPAAGGPVAVAVAVKPSARFVYHKPAAAPAAPAPAPPPAPPPGGGTTTAPVDKPGDACKTTTVSKGYEIGTPGVFNDAMICIPDPAYQMVF
jgi:hypothetical protein